MPLSEVRTFLPLDLPLIHRLTPRGVGFDSLSLLTRGVHTVEGAVWGVLPMADWGTPTLVLREGDAGYIAQFRHRMGDSQAHIVFIAPDVTDALGEEAWMRLVNAMIVGAGRRGAFNLNAEVPEETAAYDILRRSGFATYARQLIWYRPPKAAQAEVRRLLRPSGELDAVAVNSLYLQSVPHIVRQVDPAPDARHGLVFEQKGRVEAFFAAQEGKNGIYLSALMNPDVFRANAAEVVEAAVASLSRADKLPVFFCVRRYQEWLFTALESAGFSPYTQQAVMAKHTVRRVEDCAYKPAMAAEELRLRRVIDYYEHTA